MLSFLIFFKIFFINEEAAEYLDSIELSWTGDSGCINTEAYGFDANSEGIVALTNSNLLKCRTQDFTPKGKILKLHYAYNIKTAGTSHPYRITLFSNKGEKVKEFEIPNTSESRTNSWNELLLGVSDLVVGNEKYFLEVSTLKKDLPAISIRDRLDFLNKYPRGSSENVQKVVSKYFPEIVVSCLIFFTCFCLSFEISSLGYLAILFLLSIGLHLSNSPFFYYDEWHVIQRFAEVSFPESIIYTHNEHFLPLFFGWFYAMLKIFSGEYQALLVVSCGLLALYSFVFANLLIRLSVQEKTARLLSLLFCASSLNIEVMQWAFEQSILLCGIFGLCYLIQAVEFLKYKSIKSLIFSFVLILCAPMLFGGGFAYLPIGIAMMIFLSSLVSEVSVSEKFKRISIFTVVNSIAIGVPLSLYVYFKNSSTGHAVEESSFFADPTRFFSYLFEGVGLGSVLRPLGFYPILSLTSPQEILNRSFPFLRLGFTEFEFSIYSFAVSLAVVVLLGFFARNKFGGFRTLFFILAGSALIVVFFVIFTAGRWHLGANQSLALRYQVQVLPGLLLIIAPFIETLKGLGLNNRLIRIAALVSLLVWITIQSVAISTFSYFKYNGDKDRTYIQAAVSSLDKNGNIIKGDAKSLPIHEPGITPGRGLLDLNKSYHWLITE